MRLNKCLNLFRKIAWKRRDLAYRDESFSIKKLTCELVRLPGWVFLKAVKYGQNNVTIIQQIVRTTKLSSNRDEIFSYKHKPNSSRLPGCLALYGPARLAYKQPLKDVKNSDHVVASFVASPTIQFCYCCFKFVIIIHFFWNLLFSQSMNTEIFAWQD